MKRSATSPPSRPESADAADKHPVWCAAAIALLGARWLVPTEAPEQGRTLWIVVAWFALAAAWCWRCQRLQLPGAKWDRWDALIVALCGGYVLSAARVLNENLLIACFRSTLTMLWEWAGLAVALLLCRRLFRDAPARQSLLIAFTSLVVALAGLGVWQHHVWYPNLGRQFAEFESLSGRSDLTPADRRQLQALRDELGPEISLLDSSSRDSFRNRVLSSTEPVGRFALANSYAALLLFAAIVLIGRGLSLPKTDWSWSRLVPLIAACLLVGYVLLLTKSRSAWMGMFAAALIAAFTVLLRQGERKLSRGLIVGATVIVVLLIAVTWLTGGVDRLVLSEAGKSLRYRFEFWEATWGVIREQPWFGTGPGNFRSHYLQYKLPGSSEELLDPHNLFLEVWAIGGILPLMALVALLLGATWNGFSQLGRPQQSVAPQWGVTFWGVAGAGLTTFLWSGLMAAVWDQQLLVIMVGALCVIGVWRAVSSKHAGVALDQPAVLIALLTALFVHLLTSGGIGMPGITQLVLLICLFLVDGSQSSSLSMSTSRVSQFMNAAGAILMAASLLIAVQTGLKPVANATLLVQAGDVEALQNQGSEKAMQYYTLACEADPLDPISWNRRAQLLLARWEAAGSKATRDRLLEEAVKAYGEVHDRDRENPRLIFETGQMYWRAYQRGDGEEWASVAAENFLRAAGRYPNSSLFQSSASLSLQAIGRFDEAQRRAVRALELDDLNRAAGHTDRYLPDDMQQELLLIANQPLPEGEGN